MSEFDSPLNNVRVASPCPADWNAMQGDDRKRYCGECKLNVYNLSGMTRYDAEHLLRMSEGRLCVRYYQRQDGSILTKDCPVGWARVKQRVSIMAAAVFSLVISLLGTFAFVSWTTRRLPAVVGQMEMPRPTPTPSPTPDVEIMGGLEYTPPPAAKAKTLKFVGVRDGVVRVN